MSEILVRMHGRDQAFSDRDLWGGDPSDPATLLNAMERLPGTYAFYASMLQEARSELSRAAEQEATARAALAHRIAERETASAGKKPAAAEVERILARESDELLRALDAAQDAPPDSDEPAANYAASIRARRDWSEIADKLSVVVDTVRLRCSMVRGQAGLVETMLQQNLISPNRSRRPDARDRIGGPDDDGTL